MNWLTDLFVQQSIAQTVVAYGVVIALGVALGRVRILGISLGTTWVLFVGILLSYLGLVVADEVRHFLRDFGLILFVYALGLQVGPGFFASLNRNALLDNALSGAAVIMGTLLTIGFYFLSDFHIGIMAGVMSGAVTNTPGLGAAQTAIVDLRVAGVENSMITLAYATAYPFGVVGIILVMVALRRFLKVDVEKVAQVHRRLNLFRSSKLVVMHLQLENRLFVGRTVRSLFMLLQEPIVISRMLQDGRVITPTPDTTFQQDDILLIISPRGQVAYVKKLIGRESEIDLRKVTDSVITDRIIVVTHAEVTHKRLGAVPELQHQDFTITRLARAGVEILPTAGTFLQLGDTLRVVGTEESLDRVSRVLGNSLRKLDAPDLAPIFVGIVLGVILGSMPIQFPGMPASIKVGLAGGPLIISLLLSRFGGVLYLNNYTTISTNMMLRELGIALFLASVGLGSGGQLVEAFAGGRGWAWMGMGAVITTVPLLVVGLIGAKLFRKTYFELCGLLAGAATDPPALAFATKMSGSEIPATTYATIYPFTMILRVVAAQMLILLFGVGG